MAFWNLATVTKLIDIWADEKVQDMLDSSYRNSDVFKDIAERMSDDDTIYTWQQCRNKIKSLRAEYRKAKSYQEKSGSGRTRFIYYDKMDAVLGDRPSITPQHVVDTSEVYVSDEDDVEEDSLPSLPSRASTPKSIETEGVAEESADETTVTVEKTQENAELPKITKKPRMKTSDKPKHNDAELAGKTKDDDTPAGKPKEVNKPITESAEKTKEGDIPIGKNKEVNKSETTVGSAKMPASESTKKLFTSGFQIRKRKKPQENQGLKEAMENFVKMEEKSNTKQLEMEENLAKNHMEFEMKLRQLDAEREDKRRREERHFQLQMMQMQMQMFGGLLNQGFSNYNDTQTGPSFASNIPMQYPATQMQTGPSSTVYLPVHYSAVPLQAGPSSSPYMPNYLQQGLGVQDICQGTPDQYSQTNYTCTPEDDEYDGLKTFTKLI